MPATTFLITGATRTVGRHVVDELLKAGAPVRALTRAPARADLPAGVRGVRGVQGVLTRLGTPALALCGRPPRTFARWAAAHAEAFL